MEPASSRWQSVFLLEIGSHVCQAEVELEVVPVDQSWLLFRALEGLVFPRLMATWTVMRMAKEPMPSSVAASWFRFAAALHTSLRWATLPVARAPSSQPADRDCSSGARAKR